MDQTRGGVGHFRSLRRVCFWLILSVYFGAGAGGLNAQTTNLALPSFDFTDPAVTQAWLPTHDIASLQTTSTGLVVNISGMDPYLTGPARDYPASTPLWARLRLYSDQAGTAQLFYYQSNASEPNSVRFGFPAQTWAEARVPVPALGRNYHLRFDPPGVGGKAVLGLLSFEARGDYPDFDFKTLPDAASWSSAHDIASLQTTSTGLIVNISGGDPYLYGPTRNYPTNQLLWLHLRLKSDQGGGAQVFYFTNGPTEANSIKFFVPPGVWYEAVAPMPALGPGWQLRIDPPGSGGFCALDRLWFEPRVLLQAPVWPKPTLPTIGADALKVQSGDLELTYDRYAWGAFEVKVAGVSMGVGYPEALSGYLSGGTQRWLSLGHSPTNPVTVALTGAGLSVAADTYDPDGARWRTEQLFSATNGGVILVESRVTVNQDRLVDHLPMFLLISGLGAFGANKTQGLFCGLEYLENEPSSSEADIIGPGSQRQVPDMVKVTLPLMALAAQDRYVAALWQPETNLCAVFDSPDRLFASGGHVMGLLFPGSDGQNRQEGNLLPYGPALLRSNETLVLRAAILGGQGQTVVPAVQQYAALCGLPTLPQAVPAAADYYNLAARGWLDSQIRSNGWFRSALGASFGFQPAADAAVWMRWLEPQVTAADLPARLASAAGAAIQQVPQAQNFNDYQIGHIHYPLPALGYNEAVANALAAQVDAQGLLPNFQPDGSVLYHPVPGGTDYGTTHYAPDANGLTATYVQSLLENAAFAGDPALLATGLRYLRALNKFRNTVPRGAQTWEVPLHTPDILASAKLLRCYTLGYELTGDPDFLAQARYWAWTGVPFVYLTPPTPGAVGLYATIPVYGASGWVTSWLGVPVQWCGLVYADALYRFAKYDPAFSWRQVADGIAASGVQQSWTPDDLERLGLLPDSYQLRPQVRNDPAINPGTVQAAALRYYRQPAAYDFHSFPWHGWLVHAPGEIGAISEHPQGVAFTVTNWSSASVSLLANGFNQEPQVQLNGQPIQLVFPHQYQASAGRLVLRLQGTVKVEIFAPAPPPRLGIRAPGAKGMAEFFWPASAAGFVLEAAPSLTGASLWQPVSASVILDGETLTVSEPATAVARFYRLRKGP